MGDPWGGPDICPSCDEWTAGDGDEIAPHLEELAEELGWCSGCLQLAYEEDQKESKRHGIHQNSPYIGDRVYSDLDAD